MSLYSYGTYLKGGWWSCILGNLSYNHSADQRSYIDTHNVNLCVLGRHKEVIQKVPKGYKTQDLLFGVEWHLIFIMCTYYMQ